MNFYAGLDISSAETAICITNVEGTIIKEGSVPTEPEAIDAFLGPYVSALKEIGMEAGNLSIWLYRKLMASGLPVTCIDARHANAIIGIQSVKTDKNDARVIANIMRTKPYRPVHVKSDASQRIKILVNNRRCLVDQRVVIDNQIRGTLKIFGLKTGEVTPKQYEPRIRELIDGDGELEAAILPMLKVRQVIQQEVAVLDKVLMQFAKTDPVCRRLMTIPSIGVLTAVLFRVVIDDPERFHRSKDVAAHIGMTPRKYASGDVDYNGRITKCGDAMLRNHLYEAASIILRPSTKRNPIKTWGLRIAKRSSLKNARVAVARKLAVVMHRIWMDESEFDWGTAVVGSSEAEVSAAA